MMVSDCFQEPTFSGKTYHIGQFSTSTLKALASSRGLIAVISQCLTFIQNHLIPKDHHIELPVRNDSAQYISAWLTPCFYIQSTYTNNSPRSRFRCQSSVWGRLVA